MSLGSRTVKEVPAHGGISSFPRGFIPPDWASWLILCLCALERPIEWSILRKLIVSFDRKKFLPLQMFCSARSLHRTGLTSIAEVVVQGYGQSCLSALAWTEKSQSNMVSGAPLSTLLLQNSLENVEGVNLHPSALCQPDALAYLSESW